MTEESTKPKEEMLVLRESVIHNSIGCEHYFIQKKGTTVECRKCGLGLWGHATGGKLQK
jgi:hypothetical protein